MFNESCQKFADVDRNNYNQLTCLALHVPSLTSLRKANVFSLFQKLNPEPGTLNPNPKLEFWFLNLLHVASVFESSRTWDVIVNMNIIAGGTTHVLGVWARACASELLLSHVLFAVQRWNRLSNIWTGLWHTQASQNLSFYGVSLILGARRGMPDFKVMKLINLHWLNFVSDFNWLPYWAWVLCGHIFGRTFTHAEEMRTASVGI